jgi:hypothetical protein
MSRVGSNPTRDQACCSRHFRRVSLHAAHEHIDVDLFMRLDATPTYCLSGAIRIRMWPSLDQSRGPLNLFAGGPDDEWLRAMQLPISACLLSTPLMNTSICT